MQRCCKFSCANHLFFFPHYLFCAIPFLLYASFCFIFYIYQCNFTVQFYKNSSVDFDQNLSLAFAIFLYFTKRKPAIIKKLQKMHFYFTLNALLVLEMYKYLNITFSFLSNVLTFKQDT